MTIGGRLRALRLQMKMTQTQFGDIFGVSKGLVSQWESDRVVIPTERIIKLRSLRKFSADWLLFGEHAQAVAPEMTLLLRAAQELPAYAVGMLTHDAANYKKLLNIGGHDSASVLNAADHENQKAQDKRRS